MSGLLSSVKSLIQELSTFSRWQHGRGPEPRRDPVDRRFYRLTSGPKPETEPPRCSRQARQ